jgi:hypothetical protein
MNDYTETTERSTMDGGDDGSPVFPLHAYCCIPFPPSLVYVNKPKALVTTEVYQVVITTNICWTTGGEHGEVRWKGIPTISRELWRWSIVLYFFAPSEYSTSL